jgi:hypothetical protein
VIARTADPRSRRFDELLLEMEANRRRRHRCVASTVALPRLQTMPASAGCYAIGRVGAVYAIEARICGLDADERLFC